MIRNILLALIVAINLYFIIYFLRDLFKTNKISKKNQGYASVALHVIYHLLSFNIWRFRLCYRNRPLSKVEMGQHEKLPGTLNTQCSTGSRHGIVLYHCYQRRDQDISCLYYLPNYRCIFRTKICREVTRENDQTVCRHRIGHCCILNFMGQMNWIPQTEQPVNCMAEN